MGILEKIQKQSFQKHTEKNLEQRDLSQVNSKLRTLGFLVDEHTIQEFEPLYDFSKSLELQPKDVKVFSFQEVKKKTPSLRQNQVNNKDFTWKGEIHNDNALEFLNLPFDILVGLYDGPHPYLDLMVSKSKAKFKVGCKNADERLYDLIITIPAGELQLLESELKKYVTVLNKL
ncbi:MAG TPA: hypothetical protein PKW08_10125 [Flavobacteriaceae bacterium]|mgnify:CR=1 FL=1|nr:hypothetical protein [Flavobacteriaceae bacterium]MCB9214160.1 hypothetical protein [Alteromonas sp.]HPF11937.1 hypothetical protein [Flavobacteriaceae bacterium]HQU21931.1 hypothetical protein [Flavobacteriaceae bacterium]HQU65431.1 hypothetical protein [Flavobacteriaceae bacterium]